MFIAHLKDGSHFVSREDVKTWDDVPDIGISSLQLSLPFTIKKRMENGDVQTLPPSFVTLPKGFSHCYFMNEAVALVQVAQPGPMELNQNPSITGATKGFKVAEIMAGIYDDLGIVIEVRVDKDGNVTHRVFPISQLESQFLDENRNGSFDQTCLRKGI